MIPQKKSFWLDYDLGLRGNYTGLFNFLDNYNAIECGSGLAYFVYENPRGLTDEDLLEELKKEIEAAVTPASSDRIYIIWRTETQVKGRFLFGNRKAAPWTGYGDRASIKENEEAI
jgi:hypothetical protein